MINELRGMHGRMVKIPPPPFLSAATNKFQQLQHVLFKNISMDESVIGFKGRISLLH